MNRTMIKRGILGATIVLLAIVAFLSVSYLRYSETVGNIDVYYLNTNKSGIEPVEMTYDINMTNDELVAEVFRLFANSTVTGKSNLVSAKPISLEVLEYNVDYETGFMEVDFSSEYKDMSNIEEINFKSAFVWTFTDLGFIKKVSFKIDGYPYTTNSSQVIEYFDRTNIMVEPTIALDKVVQREIILYYPTSPVDENSKLVAEERVAITEESIPIEEVVVTELLKGPQVEGNQSMISEKVSVRSIKRSNYICFIDLDEQFLKGNLSDQEQKLRVYSLVNTLTELSNIDTVQILINAKKTKGFDAIDISKPLKRNEYYIQ